MPLHSDDGIATVKKARHREIQRGHQDRAAANRDVQSGGDQHGAVASNVLIIGLSVEPRKTVPDIAAKDDSPALIVCARDVHSVPAPRVTARVRRR